MLHKFLFASSLAFASLASSVFAQTDYPKQTIRLIVPFAPGGSADLMGRLMAEELSPILGQPVIVENKGGAGGSIGGSYVARSKPDGYTLLIAAAGPIVVNPNLYSDLNYSPSKDLAAITAFTREHNLFAVNASSNIKTLSEFIDYAKEKNQPLTFGSPGTGTPAHLAGELLRQKTNLAMTHVPYKGSNPAVVDLIAGHIDFMIDNMPPLLPHVQSGKLRAIAVPSTARSQAVPETPTFKESGMEDFVVMAWKGLAAPAGTPKEIIDHLYQATQQVLAKPDVQKRLNALGAEPEGNTPEEFARQIQEETVWWGELIKSTGTSVQ